jgi:hypothetical protein
VRVYIPATSASLDELSRRGVISPPPITAFAVTPALREWYLDDDIEELEYAASSEAARACLRLLSADPGSARRRIVIAADVPDSSVEVRDDLDRGVVHIRVEVELGWCASVHADDGDAEAAVEAAASAIDAADLGDPQSEEIVDDADGFELSWYATQEISDLLSELSG